MNKLLYCIALFLISSFTYSQNKLEEIKNFGENPGNLKMYFYENHHTNKTTAKKPLIVVLHGCSQTAEKIARQSGWNKLADINDFYIIYPEQKMVNNPNKCFNWFLEDDYYPENGEAASIKQMIDFSMKEYSIDSSKIFIYGVSAGAAMSVAMMANFPNIFQAGASYAGGAFLATKSSEALKNMLHPKLMDGEDLGKTIKLMHPKYDGKFPKLIAIHGKEDLIVNFKNSEQLIEQWKYLHKNEIKKEILFENFHHSDVKKTVYENEYHEAQVIFYEIKHLGHSIMIDVGESEKQGGENGLFISNKGFHSTYWIAKDFGLIND
jgi:poly(hydroxyalkanoate) depolymerase family esterase